MSPISARAAVVVLNEPDAQPEWRSFVYLLCLSECVSVCARLAVWATPFVPGAPSHVFSAFAVLGLAHAISIYAVGSTVRRNSRGTRFCVLAGLAIWFAWIMVLVISENLARTPGWFMWFTHRFASNAPVLSCLCSLILDGNDVGLLQWIFFLLIGWRLVSNRTSGIGQSHRMWVALATAWCCLYVLEATYYTAWFGYGWLRPGWWFAPAAAAHLILPVLTAGLLLGGYRTAALPAIVMAAGGAGRALLELSDWDRWVYVVFTAGLGIRYAAPWLIIAAFAWRARMASYREDGSPYPRRYCGRCRYNLHGLDSARCPECGAELERPGTPSPEVTAAEVV
jgi:hypothetical protein